MTIRKLASAMAVSVSLLLLFAVNVMAVDLSGLTLIRDIKLLASPEEIRIVVKTGGKPLFLPDVRIVNDRLLQLDVDKSYTEPAKRSFSINDPFLEKVDIYQMDATSVRIRLHLLSPFEKGGDSVWRNDGGFILSLKRKPVASVSKPIPTAKTTVPPVAEPSPVLNQVKEDVKIAGSVKTSDEPFSSVFNEDVALPGGAGGSGVNSEQFSGTSSIIRMLSSLAIVVGLLLLGAYIFKKKMLDKGGLNRGGLIKVIDRSYIDLKKGIAIVDVAGEMIVVGLSGDNITMLTKIEDEAALARVRKLMQKDDKPLFSAIVDDASAKINTSTPSVSEEIPAEEELPSEESILDRIKKLKPLK